jgi:hypothetical protein
MVGRLGGALAGPVTMRRGAGLDPNQARRQLLEERQDVSALQLAADDHLAFRVDAVHLKDRLQCRDRSL